MGALAYYNEWEAYPAEWLRRLMGAGLIMEGVVDEQDIQRVRPSLLAGYERCHFFAGIGGWELALQLAGWPEGAEVWTGSCPCQPFSVAGKGKGTQDVKYVWPVWRTRIALCRPAVIFGEQVTSPLGREWLSRVRADLEALGYAVGAGDLCAASAGAPHGRQRLWWVADSTSNQRKRNTRTLAKSSQEIPARPQQVQPRNQPRGSCSTLSEFNSWKDTEWRTGTDGTARRVKPGLCIMVNGIPTNLDKILAAYGNAIVPQVAAEFIAAYMEVRRIES